MAKLKKVSEDEYQLVCDCLKFVHSLTMKDGKPHVETMTIKGKDTEHGPSQKRSGTLEDWFPSKRGNNTDAGDADEE